MELIVNKMNSTVRAVDSQALLHPQVMDSITDKLIARVKDYLKHEQTVKEERKMRPSMTSHEISSWE